MKKALIVTGGSDGIGQAITAAVAQDWHVVNLARDQAKGEAAAARDGSTFIACDVVDYASVEHAVNQVSQQFGRIDALVNNAGLWLEGPLEATDPDRMKAVLMTNTLGVLNVTKAVIPALKTAGGGVVININSQAGLFARKELAVYDASKFGVTGLTLALQDELAEAHIRVTGVHPGKVATELFAKAGNQKKFDNAIQPQDVARVVCFILDTDPSVHIPQIGIKHS